MMNPMDFVYDQVNKHDAIFVQRLYANALDAGFSEGEMLACLLDWEALGILVVDWCCGTSGVVTLLGE